MMLCWKYMRLKMGGLAVLLFGALAAVPARSGNIVPVTPGNFNSDASLITFDELIPGAMTVPAYAPSAYGGGPGAPTVTFGGRFAGQSPATNPHISCPGVAAYACIVGTPTGPLSLNPSSFSPTVSFLGGSPALCGEQPSCFGAIAILFSTDLAAVGFDAAALDQAGSAGITAFARDGSLLGTVLNSGTGFEFLGLATADGSNKIAGVLLSEFSHQQSGVAMDNLRFGLSEQITLPHTVPEPAPWVLMIAGLGLAGGALRGSRRQRRHMALRFA